MADWRTSDVHTRNSSRLGIILDTLFMPGTLKGVIFRAHHKRMHLIQDIKYT